MNNVPAPCAALDPTPKHLTVHDAARWLGVSDSHCFKLSESGKLRFVKVGHRRLIESESIVEYLARPNLEEWRQRRLKVRPEQHEVIVGRRPVENRYPMRPLVVLLEKERDRKLDNSKLAVILCTGRDTVRRAWVEGIAEPMADRWAIRVGWHPALVWGMDWWRAHEQRELAGSMRRHPSADGGSLAA